MADSGASVVPDAHFQVGLTIRDPISLRFDKLVSAVTVNGQSKTIMQSVSGTFQAGRFAAVMGPSGAGKVSFLFQRLWPHSFSALIFTDHTISHSFRQIACDGW
jgi:ABC-type multidrug transport system ATPase subunit